MRRSIPAFCIACRVLAMRAWYSLRSNGKRTACCIVSGMLASSDIVENASGAHLPCNDLAEFGKARIGGNHARMNGVMQLAKHACLRQAVADIACRLEHG